jgi:hypothetical protein
MSVLSAVGDFILCTSCLVLMVLAVLFVVARRREKPKLWRSPNTGLIFRDWREI